MLESILHEAPPTSLQHITVFEFLNYSHKRTALPMSPGLGSRKKAKEHQDLPRRHASTI